MNGIEVELMWSTLRSVVSERAKAMQRTAFSPVVREAGDLSYGLFDARGRMIAQADTGTPGHTNCLAKTGAHLTELFRDHLEPGDVLVTNDPYRGAGHFFDITVYAPIYKDGRIIGYVGSTNHHTDIGGSGVGPGAHDVHEEGLWIPPAKLFERGEPNKLLFDIMRHNVRSPDYLVGDLMAQVGSARDGESGVIELCRRFNLDDLEELSDEIIHRSETAMRRAIREYRAGSWTAATAVDFGDGPMLELQAQVTTDPDEGEVVIDFAGSSPQVGKGINVVLSYTQAYAAFTIRSCFAPNVPNNTGSLMPIKVTAPTGSILNCTYPAPVAARHMVGMLVPMPILKALHNVVSERVLAEGPGTPFTFQIIGSKDDNSLFVSSLFTFSGGMGARQTKPGLNAVSYPTGIAATPIEVIEHETPIVFRRRELRHGSGGAGNSAGGDGQIVEFSVDTQRPWTLNAVTTCTRAAAKGLAGGEDGAPGRILLNGKETSFQGKTVLSPTDVVYMETPGGGGYASMVANIKGGEQ
jgi:N-methylhydantoinase B